MPASGSYQPPPDGGGGGGSGTDDQILGWNPATATLSIEDGNTVDLSDLTAASPATDAFGVPFN